MRYIAGERASAPSNGNALHVDYADVLRQAVENERWKVLRELLAVVEEIPTTRQDNSSTYRSEPRTAETFKTELVRRLNAMGRS